MVNKKISMITILAVLTIVLMATMISAQVNNTSPRSIKTLEEIVLREGIPLTLNLSEYYVDDDGDNITYTAENTGNITSDITGEELKITPLQGFSGLTQIKLKIMDQNDTVSNTFNVVVLPGTTPKTNNTDTTNTTTNQTTNNSTSNTTIKKESVQNNKIFGDRGDKITLSVTSLEGNQESLEYSWYVNGAIVEGNGSERVFDDLKDGKYNISVILTDGIINIEEFWEVQIGEEEIRIPGSDNLKFYMTMGGLIILGALAYFLIFQRKSKPKKPEDKTLPSEKDKTEDEEEKSNGPKRATEIVEHKD